MNTRMNFFTVVMLALAAGPLGAGTVDEVVRANAHTLSLDADGNLVGSGSDVLIIGGRQAQFVLVGEEHGVAEVPAIAAGLFRALAPSGYRYVAIETGPPMAAELNRRAAQGGVEALREFVDTHYPGTPFYGVREEAEFLVAAVKAAGGGRDVLWGLDYEVMGDRYPLRRLRDLASSEETRAAVDDVIAVADSMFEEALAQGNPSKLFCFAGDVSLIERLMDHFEVDSEGWLILSTLQETLSINELWREGRGLESNQARAANLKHNFMTNYLRALAQSSSPPKVMLKFGANHMIRGWNFTEQLDLGTLASVIAEANHSRSFNIMIVDGEGGQHAGFDPQTFGVTPRPSGFPEEPWFKPFLGQTQWTVFDLRPVRRQMLAHKLDDEVSDELEQIVRGFDVLVVVPNAKASTHLAPR